MRRYFLYIIVTVLTFSIGFYTDYIYEHLDVVLPISFGLWLLVRKVSITRLTSHHVKVALITLALWVIAAFLIIRVFTSPCGLCDCVVDLDSLEINWLHPRSIMRRFLFHLLITFFTLAFGVWADLYARQLHQSIPDCFCTSVQCNVLLILAIHYLL